MSEHAAATFDHRSELWTLLSGLCDGLLSAAERDRLEAVLSADVGAKRLCAAYLDQHAQMLWRYRDADTEPRQSADDAKPQSAAALPAADPGTPGSGSPLLGFLHLDLSWIRTSSRVLGMALGGLLLGYFVVMFALIPLARRAESQRAQPAPGAPDVAAQQRNIGTLLAEPDTRWASEKTSPVGNVARIGERCSLKSGRAKIELRRGIALAIEGPAVWRLEAEGRLQLESGKLFARVPRAAIGFTVATPAGEVVDLGTEFGVVVSDGATEVHVLRGRVEVKQSRPGGVATQSGIKVVAGNAVRMGDRGRGFSPIVLNRAGFAAASQNLSVRSTTEQFSGADSPDLPARSVTFQDGVAGYSGTQDTFIHGRNPDSNYGTDTSIGVFEQTTEAANYARGLIRFDLSSVAPGTLVTGAELTLCQQSAEGALGVSNSLYVIAAAGKAWTELGVTSNNSVGGTAWTGGAGLIADTDYSASAVATAVSPAAVQGRNLNLPMTFTLNRAGVAAIQRWVNNPSENSGVLLRQSDASNSIDVFWSREATDVPLRPALTLTVIAPGAG